MHYVVSRNITVINNLLIGSENMNLTLHYSDVIMGAMASQITSLTIVYSTVYSGADQRKHQSSAPLAFVRGTHRRPVNSPHKWPVTRKMFPFDDVIIAYSYHLVFTHLGPALNASSRKDWFHVSSNTIKSTIWILPKIAFIWISSICTG